MNSNLKTIKDALAILKCADSTFHSCLEKTDIKPIRVGRRSFFTLEQIEILKSYLDNEPIQAEFEKTKEGTERSEVDLGEEEQYNKELREAQEEIQMLSMQVSQWQHQAQAYQEQYQKLLDSQQEANKAEKVIEENAGKKAWWKIW